MTIFEGTTILIVRHNGQVAVCGDGQVSLGPTVIKGTARKIRRIGQDQKVICGFSGATADALAIMERFEEQLAKYGQLVRAAVELAKQWRTDRNLRRLEANLLTCDAKSTLLISGAGDVLEPDDNVLATGSGGYYALAAARALCRHAPNLSAPAIAQESLKIASEICVYTNSNFLLEVLQSQEETK
ncbi:MAG: ATP-dependent protease subunit HslV [Deltaproteobacteria bacterium]|jgi:ATP-dependent HslUV protease subunit HslV|nr:ATP-dependent protease subunit HslV [Deltaproteobacteria bacterium]